MSKTGNVPIEEIIKKLIKKVLLEETPEAYCYEDQDGCLRINISHKKSDIILHSVPVYEEIRKKSFLRTVVTSVKTDQYVSYAHVYSKDNSVDPYHNPFTGEDAQEIVSWMRTYKKRYKDNELDKQIKFLESL